MGFGPGFLFPFPDFRFRKKKLGIFYAVMVIVVSSCVHSIPLRKVLFWALTNYSFWTINYSSLNSTDNTSFHFLFTNFLTVFVEKSV